MSPTDQLLLLLHSADWAEHKIGSAYEAAFDIILTPKDEFPTTIDDLSQRWNVHRGTARRYFRDAQQLLIDILKTVPASDKDEEPNGADLRHEGLNGAVLRHNPSRDNINLNALSEDKASVSVKRVRERFVRPSPEEVNDYLCQIGETRFTGQEFYNYYESVGWVVGRDRKPMKSWQAAVRTWQHYRKTTSKTDNTSSNTPHHYANSATSHHHPSDRVAERELRQQQFAQHIAHLLDDPGAEREPELDF